jgi:hypothetical protein
MPGITQITPDFRTCTNQADALALTLTPSEGVSLVGAVVTVQIRRDAIPAVPVLAPTVSTTMTGANLTITASWTFEQSKALEAFDGNYSSTTDYVAEVDVALTDRPTEPVMRFVRRIKVAPGGNL